MKRIVYIGMDVHSTNFRFCSLEPKLGGEDKFFGCMQSEADVKNVLKYIEGLKKELGDDVEFLCGYEAGCLGFSLYHQLKKQGVECVILAPSTMMASKGKRIKTDARDAKRIAQCLAYETYSRMRLSLYPLSYKPAKTGFIDIVIFRYLTGSTSSGVGGAPVFCSEDGTPFRENSWGHRLRQYAAKLGKAITPYHLRHAAALGMLRRGMNVFALRDMMGHADLSTTQKYLALTLDDLRRAHAESSLVNEVAPRRHRGRRV